MPKSLIVFGSPKHNSFTAKLVNGIKPIFGDDCITYDCFKMSPAPCDACNHCQKTDGCKFTDLNEFFDNFEKAEEIIIAFPLYNGSFPAPLKALIDRFQRFYNKRFALGIKPPMKGKRDVTLIITSGSKTDHLPQIISQLSPLFTISGCTLKKAIILNGTDSLSPNQKLNPKTIEF